MQKFSKYFIQYFDNLHLSKASLYINAEHYYYYNPDGNMTLF